MKPDISKKIRRMEEKVSKGETLDREESKLYLLQLMATKNSRQEQSYQ